MNNLGRFVLSQALTQAKCRQITCLGERNGARLHLQECERNLADAEAAVVALSADLQEAGGLPIVKPAEVAA
jgi:hypothetical protein